MSADGKLLAKQTGTQNVTHDGAVATKPSYSGKIVDENGNVLNVDNTKATIKHTIGWSEHKETPNSHYLYSGDDYLGNITEKKTVKGPLDNEYQVGGDINVKSQHFAGIDIQRANSTQRHQVRTGETLKSISVLYYGSEDFWYIIADANGIANSPTEALSGGQTLDIPQMLNASNSAYDLKPMNLAEALGDTTPALPYVPPPAEAGCNAVATLVVVAVAVAVTGGVAGATVFNGSAILGGAVGAAAGSVASQVVGIGLGVQEKFSWSQVAVAAVTGGVAGGISDKIASANGLSGGANATSSTNNLWVSDGALSGFSRGVASAGASIAGAATAKVLNGHSGFSWANIASSAVVAGIGGRLPGEGGANGQNFGADVLAQVGRSAVGYGVNRAFGGDQSWNNRDIAVDAFGNAIGNSIVQGLQSKPKPKVQDPDTGKSSPSLVEEFDVMKAAAKVKSQQQKENQRLNDMVDWGDAFASSQSLTTESTDQVVVNPMKRYKPFVEINTKEQTSIDVGGIAKGIERVHIDPAGNKGSFFDDVIDVVGRSFDFYGDMFGRIYDRTNQYMNDYFDERNSLSDGVRTYTESLGAGLDGGYLGFNGDILWGISNNGKIAFNVSVGAGFQTPSYGYDYGYTNQEWVSGLQEATPSVILNGWGSSTEVNLSTPLIFDIGIVNSRAWSESPYVSGTNAYGSGYQIKNDMSYSPLKIIDASNNVNYAPKNTYMEFDAGWLGKALFWARD